MSHEPALSAAYDLAVLDLDGVVYIGAHAVPGAIEALAAAQEAGMHLAFVTNNASRSPAAVAAHLGEIGIETGPEDVVTSAQAAAGVLAGEIPAGSAVFVIGGPGLHDALRERGLVPVTSLDERPVAVVQGYGPDMPWRQVIDGALLVRDGLPWVASNTDLTVPTEHGPGPGNGTLVRLVAEYAGREPVVAGKPQPPLFRETLARVGGRSPLVVGDRIDTDIEGARNVGWDSLLVMTGVTTLADLAAVAPDVRPTYVAADLSRLAQPKAPRSAWSAEVTDGALRITGSGDLHGWWHAVATALWAHLDDTGQPASVEGVDPGSVTS
ncbi:MAG: HAD-IIA family hydrolase [Marmoricola sp.]